MSVNLHVIFSDCTLICSDSCSAASTFHYMCIQKTSQGPIGFQHSFLIHLCSWCECNLQQRGGSLEVRELKITKTCGMLKGGQHKQAAGLALHPCRAQPPPSFSWARGQPGAAWAQVWPLGGEGVGNKPLNKWPTDSVSHTFSTNIFFSLSLWLKCKGQF